MTAQFSKRTHPAQDVLAAVGRVYPQAWQQADAFRAMRGRELPRWPDWCYLPLHGAYAIVSGGGDRRVPVERAHHIAIVGALAAWRMGQGVYRYDPDLAAALDSTPMPSDLPTSVLYRLPEWGVYLETPGLRAPSGRPLLGAWVSLDWDEGGADELRLVLDTDTPLDPDLRTLEVIPLLLGSGSISDAIARMLQSAQMQASAQGQRLPPDMLTEAPAHVAERLWPLLSRVLYLCADEPDMAKRPTRPEPKRVKGGWRLFPAAGLRVWPVGERIGAAIRRAQEADAAAEREALASGRARPRPHVRRAHWHSYWRGPRDGERTLIAKWQPPIAVNVDGSPMPVVVHEVE